MRGYGPGKLKRSPVTIHAAMCQVGDEKCTSPFHRCKHTAEEHEAMGWTCPHKVKGTP